MVEMVEYLDKNNQLLGVAPRTEAYQKKYKLKAAFVILTNSDGEYFISQRSKTKQLYPLKWTVGAGGAVGAGELFEFAAARELKEELGATPTIKYSFDFNYSADFGGYYGQVFLATWNGKIKLQKKEITKGHWATKEEILTLAKTGELCPDTKIFFEKYLQITKTKVITKKIKK